LHCVEYSQDFFWHYAVTLTRVDDSLPRQDTPYSSIMQPIPVCDAQCNCTTYVEFILHRAFKSKRDAPKLERPSFDNL
jgi:hypothetical protein